MSRYLIAMNSVQAISIGGMDKSSSGEVVDINGCIC